MASLAARRLSSDDDEDYLVAPKKEIIHFITECLKKTGLSSVDAETVAHHLMFADYRGIFSYGLDKMSHYINEIQKNLADSKAKPKVLNDFQAIALVDGCNGLGAVVGKYCMRMAIEKAHRYGIGLVSARGSNHFGFCGYYTLMAMERDMIGLTCTNASPLMVPTRSSTRALGTNPISVGMSAGVGDELLIDMATSAVSFGKIDLARHKNESIPKYWARDKQGNDTTDPFKASSLYPLGGPESSGGYKGYGLAIMIEVLCGILSGSEYGPGIQKWGETNRPANLGQCFIAINTAVFAPGAKNRLATLLNQLRELPRLGNLPPVKIPGDMARAAMDKADKDGGIRYPSNLIKEVNRVAQELGVPPLKLVKRKKSQ